MVAHKDEEGLFIMDVFLQNSSIHGLRYLASSQGLLPRLVWLCMLIAAFGTCTYMIADSLKENAAHPVATSMDSMVMSELPFPAVSLVQNEQSVYTWQLAKHVLNHFSFECKASNPDCAKILSAFKPLLQRFAADAVYKIANHLLQYWDVDVATKTLCAMNDEDHPIQDQLISHLTSTQSDVQLATTLGLILADHYEKLYQSPMRSKRQALNPDIPYVRTRADICVAKMIDAQNRRNALYASAAAMLAQKSALPPSVGALFNSFLPYTMGNGSLVWNSASFVSQRAAKMFNLTESYAFLASFFTNPDDVSPSETVGLERHNQATTWGQLHFDPLYIDQNLHELHSKLAQDFAAMLGVSIKEKAMRKKGHLWHCEENGRGLRDCFEFRTLFSTKGFSHTMNLNADMEQLFLPIRKYTSESDMNNDEEIKLYIYNQPGTS